MDLRRKHSRRWKEAVYLLDMGNGQELEAEQEEEERMVSEESRACGWVGVGSLLS